ncbi:2-hydroxychromene-2-carboxylate isomerase [Mesorhizobium sp. CAU 1732]|uniref:2-hydroxychromene-2-carboxylate isomerase n=1 Tax=Mesorhizobium sp. CAU 1732 TaxID=3140358 RepID=UPI003260E3E1
MSKSVEFFFDYGSPATYLAYKRLPDIARAHGAEVKYRPFLLGGLLKAVGNSAPTDLPAKREWMWQDLARIAKRYDIPFKVNSAFPVNTLVLMRAATAVEPTGRLLEFSDAIFGALWEKDRNLGDLHVLREVVTGAGFDFEQIAADSQKADVKDRLRVSTEEAADRGAFGAPTFFVAGEMHFGQDRLEYVQLALAGAAKQNVSQGAV